MDNLLPRFDYPILHMADEITKGGYFVDEAGLPRKAEDVQFADKIIELKNKEDKWAVIDMLLEAWLSRTPDEVEALKIQIEDQRENLTDREFGTTSQGQDFDRRFTLVFPLSVMRMIRAVYGEGEIDFDNHFYREFADRYPRFRIAEKD